ncbi:PQQ-binding-like beta-propeller repeat protein [Candidatus Entotheonella palauensis]|uniref:PQQ-binding-like beta-propeller repeat protein n=1 Tax=Candidatus Entotheonella palauensis TaxID=93172 RepID=UPI000B7D65B1|nr:PQQ-binding-like beta-propeller repeat protein [Candidatus Entotheonella palauensis]
MQSKLFRAGLLGILIALCLVATLYAHGYHASDTHAVNRQRTGQSPFAGPWSATDTWRVSTPSLDSITTAPAIAQDRTLYMGTEQGVVAIDQHGALKWTYYTPKGVPGTPSLSPSSGIYAGGTDGAVHALNPDGTVRWTYQTGNYIVSSPAVTADDMLYVTSFDGTIYKLTSSGHLSCRYDVGRPLIGSPSIGHDGNVYLGAGNKEEGDGRLYALNCSCQLLWSQTTSGDLHVSAAPSIASDGAIFIISTDIQQGYLEKFSAAGGPALWTRPLPHTGHASGALSPDGTTIYVPTKYGLYALATANGKLIWKAETPLQLSSTPVVDVDGNVYWGTGNTLHAFTPQGQTRWVYTTTLNMLYSPALDPIGTLFFGGQINGQQGELHAIRRVVE